MEEQKSVFETLSSINVNEHTEKKNGLTYLSWAWAWAEVKKRYPDAQYTVYERPDGVNYWTDGRTCWVKTGVTIGGLEHIEELPIMDYRNAAIPLERLTSTDVNKAIQRSLTKACARHGLGLYIYAGEDLPEGDKQDTPPEPEKTNPAAEKMAARSLCQRAVKAWCQTHNGDENACWQTIAKEIGKASKDFTTDDWSRGREIAEGWK